MFCFYGYLISIFKKIFLLLLLVFISNEFILKNFIACYFFIDNVFFFNLKKNFFFFKLTTKVGLVREREHLSFILNIQMNK